MSFSSFPMKKPELLRRWEVSLKREGFKASAHSKLCSDHFLPTDYLVRPGTSRQRLKDDVVPSVFSDFPPHLQVPVVIASVQHCYCYLGKSH